MSQFIFILFVAEYLDKNPMRNMLIVTIFVNLVGNVIYMSAASTGSGGTAQVNKF